MWSSGRKSTQKHFFQIGTVDARPKPVRAEVVSRGEMVLLGVLHGECFRESLPKARVQPVGVVVDGTFRGMFLFNEVANDLYNDVMGKTVKMKLRGMLRPMAAPVVVQIDLDRLVALVDAVGKDILDPRVLGIRDVWPHVKDEAAFILQ